MPAEHKNPISFLRLKQVKERTGLGRSSIYAQISAGKFPAQINLGARAVGWVDEDISAWMARRIAESRCGIAARATTTAEVQQ
jgi:prophage regulatory protein